MRTLALYPTASFKQPSHASFSPLQLVTGSLVLALAPETDHPPQSPRDLGGTDAEYRHPRGLVEVDTDSLEPAVALEALQVLRRGRLAHVELALLRERLLFLRRRSGTVRSGMLVRNSTPRRRRILKALTM